MLREVKLGLVGGGDETVAFPHALINRYGVDRVRADIMLGFFFPGAAMDAPEGTHAPLSAGVPAPTSDASAEAESPASPEPATSAGPT